MDPVTLLAIGLGAGLVQVANKLGEMVIEPALEPAQELLKKRIQRGYRQAEKDDQLRSAVQEALSEAGAPTDDEDQIAAWLQKSGLARLGAENAHALRRQVARGVLSFTDSEAKPPDELIVALGWPRSRALELSRLLVSMRQGLAGLDEWKELIQYADAAIQRDQMRAINNQLAKLDNLVVNVQGEEALRVVIAEMELSKEQVERIEERYREELVRDLFWHDFRGIVQVKKDVRLPLADIYQELALLKIGADEERRQVQERLLEMDDSERLREEERRLEERVSNVLSEAQRLVILGEPGAGKTLSLRFIALMLAYGYGAARLGLGETYIPMLVRLADYARTLETQPNLSFDNYLFGYIQDAYASHTRLGEYLRFVLENGHCVVLLDGLDEVGGDPIKGQPLRLQVVRRVQQFAGRWCSAGQGNRLVVTSRIEGYWDEALYGCRHVQLSPLRPPDEVGDFLLKWYRAHELALESGLPEDIAQKRARDKVDNLLPSIMDWPSVRRLATNPLLLTILALIHENVGRLPNRRIKLYEIAARTLIESWRQAQVGLPDELLAELGEDVVVRVMAPIAYWLHEAHPGGTASHAEWCTKLVEILEAEDFEEEAGDLSERFLAHARQESGLVAERGQGQYGFFHLTFEEYLAARQIARQRAEERRAMLQAHWYDPRWTEVILLASGQIGIVESRTDDASDYIEDLLQMEPVERDDRGRPALLAGRALADIGVRAVKRATRRWTQDALHETMQEIDPETKKPYKQATIPLRTRAEAADTLDELGWLPSDLYEFVLIDERAPTDNNRRSLTTEDPFYLGKYPVTNVQYARFLQAEDFADLELWRGFPKFDENARLMDEDWGDEGWHWLQENLDEENSFVPPFWNHPRFGISRRGAPVVTITWYEANAYCKWLQRHWGEVQESHTNPGLAPSLLRLPTEVEWVAAAGGDQPAERFPWDPPGQVTKELEAITQRANVRESEIGRTSMVDMYPLGASQPYGLWDLAGNVWEWQANFLGSDRGYLGLRGGSWGLDGEDARPAVRFRNLPDLGSGSFGFRVLVSPQ